MLHVPRPNIAPAPDGAKARFRYGNGTGYYDDVYVKTPRGWRFGAAEVVSDAEVAAHSRPQDFIEIRQLAGDDHGHYENLYGDHEVTSARLRGTGRSKTPAVPHVRPPAVSHAEGVRGLAYLRDNGGHYEIST